MQVLISSLVGKFRFALRFDFEKSNFYESLFGCDKTSHCYCSSFVWAEIIKTFRLRLMLFETTKALEASPSTIFISIFSHFTLSFYVTQIIETMESAWGLDLALFERGKLPTPFRFRDETIWVCLKCLRTKWRSSKFLTTEGEQKKSFQLWWDKINC